MANVTDIYESWDFYIVGYNALGNETEEHIVIDDVGLWTSQYEYAYIETSGIMFAPLETINGHITFQIQQEYPVEPSTASMTPYLIIGMAVSLPLLSLFILKKK